MQQTTYNLEEIEKINLDWTNAFAKRRGWEDHHLEDPVDDLEIFFKNLPGRRVLDAGCGWARYGKLFTERQLIYTGVDNSTEMLAVARQNNPDLQFVQASHFSLPFASGSFDGIWCCCALSGIPKEHLCKVFQEYRRMLDTLGTLMIVMPINESNESLVTCDDNSQLFWAGYHLDEFEQYLQRAGFTIGESDYRFNTGSMHILARPA